MDEEEKLEIVIVGGGICGLATALALHRKGIPSVILERSESLRASGAGITVRQNAWKALDQLGVAHKLRQTALSLKGTQFIWLKSGKRQKFSFGELETRCLKREDLIRALAESLPSGIIRFGCHVLSVSLHPLTGYPILHLGNGTVLSAKVLIGCDGANSTVADFLELEPPKVTQLCEVRGIAIYPTGHYFSNEFVQVNGNCDSIGRLPIDDNTVYWFVTQKREETNGHSLAKDSSLMKKATLDSIKEFPADMVDLIIHGDPETISVARVRYRSPQSIFREKFRKGTVTVAGDAMHVMGPFIGQGGAAGLEDAIVLARCLAQRLGEKLVVQERQWKTAVSEMEEALDEYVKERRMRLLALSAQNCLIGLLSETSSMLMKLACLFFITILFRDPNGHSRYDCGKL